MKKALIYIFVALSGLFAGHVPSFGAEDEDYETVKLYKKIIPGANDGEYTIKLEAFVTGSSTVSSSTKPADIALVLDVSWSMRETAGTPISLSSAGYSYSTIGNGTYYYSYNGSFYQVNRGGSKNSGYFLYFTVGGQNWFLKGNNTAPSRVREYTSGQSTEIWRGVLYQQVSKMDLLKDAVKNFIDVVNESSKGKDKIAGTDDDVDHKISIIKFAGTNSDDVGNQSYGTNQEYSQIVKELTSVSSGSTSLKNTVDALNMGYYTQSDYGMKHAGRVLDPVTRNSSKVVVMFTDGVPNNDGTGDFIKEVADSAILYSKKLKESGVKVYTIGIFDTETTQIRNYMNYISSNYTHASSMDDSGGTADGKDFYKLSNGSDLSDIFEKIAEETTSDVVDLHESSTSMIDIVSNNFKIPDDVVSAGKVSVEVWKATETYNSAYENVDYFYDKASDKEYYYGFTFEKDDDYTAAHTPTVVKDQDKPNSISISNFDYALDDVETGDCTGNWVGLRDVNGVKMPAGRKIVITFPITLNPDYQGGYFMPSNDFHSGIYADGNLVKPFPVPSVDFPSICIVKHGMLVGESAIFHVDGTYKDDKNNTKTVHYDVVLTQKANASGTKLPCYAILKRLNSGSYTVTETNWSWMYEADEAVCNGARSLTYSILPADQVGVTTELLSEGQDLEQNGGVIGKTATKSVSIDDVSVLMPFVMLKDSQGEYVDSAISILYEFGNVRKTSGKPARGESWKNNKFKGGTNNTGTTEGGVVEEENL